ncbi:MAG TPA: hypothetical protein VME43_07590 [Bryobacteraceae bacterium]|nr:hypothetical protein [Bryobacteraceae bacterium]
MDGAVINIERVAARNRGVDICRLVAKTKTRPQDADDRMIHTVQADIPAQCREAAREPVLPQTIADDRRGSASDPVLLCRETAPGGQANPQRTEEIGGDFLAIHVLGRAGAGQVEALIGNRSELVE